MNSCDFPSKSFGVQAETVIFSLPLISKSAGLAPVCPSLSCNGGSPGWIRYSNCSFTSAKKSFPGSVVCAFIASILMAFAAAADACAACRPPGPRGAFLQIYFLNGCHLTCTVSWGCSHLRSRTLHMLFIES